MDAVTHGSRRTDHRYEHEDYETITFNLHQCPLAVMIAVTAPPVAEVTPMTAQAWTIW
jgi:hypothetical protein